MRKLCATFEIVTPMFLGGAEQEAKHIRGASIKGALAFWWRALNYEKIFIEKNMNENAALEELQNREQRLFGGGKEGQGRFLLHVIQPNNIKTLESGRSKILTKDGTIEGGDSFDSRTRETKSVIGVGGRYLGYGLMEAFATKIDKDGEWLAKNVNSFAGQLTRSAISPNQKFELHIIFRPKKEKEELSEFEKDFHEIVKALKLFGLLGGLGSRVRRGWGSVSLTSLIEEVKSPHKAMEAYTRPMDETDYQNQLKALIGTFTTSGSNFQLTAFANETDIRVGKTHATPLAALNAIGEGFQRYRGWGKGNNSHGYDRNFVNDHNWFKDNEREDFRGRDNSLNRLPQRTGFGLPHNYHKKLGVTASNESQDVKFDRRASPLMFHIHRLGNNQCVGVASFFPTKFLSNGKAAIERGLGNNKVKTPITYDFQSNGLPVITSFLDNKKPNGSPSSPPYFPSKKLFP